MAMDQGQICGGVGDIQAKWIFFYWPTYKHDNEERRIISSYLNDSMLIFGLSGFNDYVWEYSV